MYGMPRLRPAAPCLQSEPDSTFGLSGPELAVKTGLSGPELAVKTGLSGPELAVKAELPPAERPRRAGRPRKESLYGKPDPFSCSVCGDKFYSEASLARK